MDHQSTDQVAIAKEEGAVDSEHEREKEATEVKETETESSENLEEKEGGEETGTEAGLGQDNQVPQGEEGGDEEEVAAVEAQDYATEDAEPTTETPSDRADNQQANGDSFSPPPESEAPSSPTPQPPASPQPHTPSSFISQTSEPISESTESTSEPISESTEPTSEPFSESTESPSGPISELTESTSELISESTEPSTAVKAPLVPVLSLQLDDEVLDSSVSTVESALNEASRELSGSLSSLQSPPSTSSKGGLRGTPSEEEDGHELKPISSGLETRAPTGILIPPVAQCGAWPEPRDMEIQPVIRTEFDGRIVDLVPQYFNDDAENDVWDMFMHQDPDMQPYIEAYTRTQWQLSPEGCCLERRFNFLSPPAALPSIIGTSRIPITQIHRVFRPAPEQLIYRTRAQAIGVPYGTVFAIDTRWMFMAKSEKRVSLRVYVEVTFLESCWIKTLTGAYPTAAILRAASIGAAERATRSTGELLTALAKTRELLEKERLAQLDEEEEEEGARTPLSGDVPTEDLSLSPAASQPHLDTVNVRSLPSLDSALTPTVSELASLTTEVAQQETSQITTLPEETRLAAAQGRSTDSLTTIQAMAHEGEDEFPPIPSMAMGPRLGGAKSFTLSSPSLTPVQSQLVGRLASSLSADETLSPREQRLRSRSLKRRTTLANMFDELSDSQYESIFGQDAPQRMKAAYRTRELITEQDKALVSDSNQRQRMRIWEMPEGAVFAVFGTFILMCAVVYTLQRLGQAQTVSNRLVLGQMSIDRLLETLRGMAAVSTEAAQLMLVYQAQISEMQRLVRDPTPGELNVWLSLLLFALAVGVLGTVAFSGKVIFKIRHF